MRKSRVLQKLRDGKTAYCFKVNLSDPGIVEIAGLAGFDCIWTDMEHVSNDWATIKSQVYAAKAQDADLMVRVSRGSYSDYIKPFELDAAGIMVPHIMSLEQVREVVRMTRFQPVGRRPIDGGNSDGEYCGTGLDEYISNGNKEKFVMIQIEDPEPFNELDEIAAIKGIDMIFFGAHDFSHSIGDPGNRKNHRVLEAMKRVAEAACANGKYAGAAGNRENIEQLSDLGYRFISFGADVVGIRTYCEDIMDFITGHASFK